MARIVQLPPELVAQIAAGEVIERPAAAVKELVENSIDAGATRIDIDLENGGVDLIRVVDNGYGLEPADMPLAFSRNATSKLRTADDLFNIRTMGFRGEALASIAGVAQVVMQSQTRAGATGHELRCEGATISPLRPWSGTPGTRIEVRHLFFNIPARKKFLKSQATELGQVTESLTRLALAHPTIHFVIQHNGKRVYELPATNNLVDRIGLFFGKEIRDALYPVDSGPEPVRLTGFIADPKCDRGNAKLQYLFVNGRWFRDRSIAHAMQEAYRGLLMTGRYAVGFLFIEVPPDSVDVNVHPTKAEVRFKDNSLIYSLVRASVKNRLLKENLIPHLSNPEPWDNPQPAPQATLPAPQWSLRPTVRPLFPTLDSPRQPASDAQPAPWDVPVTDIVVSPPEAPVEERLPDPPFALPSIPSGSALQVHDAYIVQETPDGMLVIDQHALHERILYEQLRTRVRDGKLEIQRLLIPEPVELTPVQAAAVLDVKEELAQLGLDVSEFGGNTVLLSSYPAMLSRRPPYEILLGIVDHLSSYDRPPTKEAMLDHLLATMACKAAVKAGDRLTSEEITHLLQLRQLAEDSHHCPHGRPTSLLFSRQQLDKQFGRT